MPGWLEEEGEGEAVVEEDEGLKDKGSLAPSDDRRVPIHWQDADLRVGKQTKPANGDGQGHEQVVQAEAARNLKPSHGMRKQGNLYRLGVDLFVGEEAGKAFDSIAEVVFRVRDTTLAGSGERAGEVGDAEGAFDEDSAHEEGYRLAPWVGRRKGMQRLTAVLISGYHFMEASFWCRMGLRYHYPTRKVLRFSLDSRAS